MGQGASSGGAPGKAGQEANGAGAEPEEQTPQYDSRLPFSNFRELYTMKNFWKAVKRGEKIGNLMLFKYVPFESTFLFLHLNSFTCCCCCFDS